MDESLLPTLYESPDVCGQISTQGAAATGLQEGTPVVAGAGDQAAGAMGMGIVSPGAVSATIGTSGVVFAATIVPRSIPRGACTLSAMQFPDAGIVMGVTQAAGLSLRWFRDQFGAESDDRPRDPYERLAAEAATFLPAATACCGRPI